MEDYETDYVYTLEDVCDRLDNIESAIQDSHHERKHNEWSSVIGGILLVWVVWWAIPAAWHSKVRYMIQYSVDYSEVHEDVRPHDCDFLKAPLGDKNCHYERTVSTIRTGRDQASGRSTVSFDDGKTWSWNDNDAWKRGVMIGWNKVED